MRTSWLVAFLLIVIMQMQTACNKLVSISDPVDQVTTNQAFSTNELANIALNSIYLYLLAAGPAGGFSAGNTTLYGALSADEILVKSSTSNLLPINTNHIAILAGNSATGGSAPTDNIWASAYDIIYKANAVIEGITASTSTELTGDVRKQLIAEAKCLRAFCYFYLTNFYGDVPLVLNIDYFNNIDITRSPQDKVYEQIIRDLKEAQADLPVDYSAGRGSRVRMNKWAATALLARTYLYIKDYDNAAAEATAVINNTDLYQLEPELNNVFLINSREAIWQINQVTTGASTNITPEGNIFLPARETLNTGPVEYAVSSQLLNAFETGDLRKQEWIDSTINDNSPVADYFPHKYKIGRFNEAAEPPIEYYLIFRLAEQYLIRAEAAANGAPGGAELALADLNAIRNRAGLPGLAGGLSQPALLEAVAKEWQTEFFCEWGQRWFNLKRTSQATNILSTISIKQPWAGDYQLLYPIPVVDIQKDRNLEQNNGY